MRLTDLVGGGNLPVNKGTPSFELNPDYKQRAQILILQTQETPSGF
jgi:hypothetical protein